MLAMDGVVPLDDRASGKRGDQEGYYGWHLAMEFRIKGDWWAGTQFDSMLDKGREMPIGPRLNVYSRIGW